MNEIFVTDASRGLDNYEKPCEKYFSFIFIVPNKKENIKEVRANNFNSFSS